MTDRHSWFYWLAIVLLLAWVGDAIAKSMDRPRGWSCAEHFRGKDGDKPKSCQGSKIGNVVDSRFGAVCNQCFYVCTRSNARVYRWPMKLGTGHSCEWWSRLRD